MACSAPLSRSCRHGRCSPAAHRVTSRQAFWPPMPAVTRSGGLRAQHRQPPAHRRGHRRPALRRADARRRPVPPRLGCPPSHLEQRQHDLNLTSTLSRRPAAPHPGLRSEMDSISEEYDIDQAATGSAQPVVSVRGLVKRYGSHEAVAGIDFDVRRGEIFAFLGRERLRISRRAPGELVQPAQSAGCRQPAVHRAPKGRLWSLPGSGGRVPGAAVCGTGCQGIGERGDGGDEVGEGCGVVFGCVALASSPCGVGGLAAGSAGRRLLR
jgi:hypothetical protein